MKIYVYYILYIILYYIAISDYIILYIICSVYEKELSRSHFSLGIVCPHLSAGGDWTSYLILKNGEDWQDLNF